MVSGMDDTAVVAVEAESLEEAADGVVEQKFENGEFYSFTDQMWPDRGGGGEPRRPSTGPVHYLGGSDLLSVNGGAIMLSEVEGTKLTAAILGDD